MIWFEGPIATAVQESKLKNAIFVVYVEGKDENSKNMSEMIDHPDALKKLGSSNFIAVKLEAGTESYNQFVQIYQLVPVPSLFFIGKNGAPIEVIPQRLEDDEFLSKLDSILQQNTSNVVNNKVSVTETSDGSSTSHQQENTVDNNKKQSDSSVDIQLTAEEKVERAKRLLEEKREAKRKEEEETLRQKEIERRKVGQDVQKMRRQQQEQELKQLRDEIKRERTEELLARQKILDQIKQDKEERAKKFNQTVDGVEPQAQPVVAAANEPKIPIARDTSTARLQFRLADGSSHTQQFPSTDTLQNIREYVRLNLNLPYRNFELSTTFPRRQFTTDDYSLTLIDLQLVPNAVILVVPVTSTAVTQASSTANYFSVVFWLLMSPVMGIYSLVRDTYNNWRNPRPAAKRPSSEPSQPGASSSSSYPKRRMPPDSTVVRRQGNIHRLTDRKDDSDDENNTWNGNSTQQM